MNNAQVDQLFGYEVRDSTGNKIGSVDNVWVDDATSDLEFIGVKTGWLMGKTHVIPTADAQVDSGSNTITVPYSESQVKDAPSYGADDELSPDAENEIYSYYGIDRSTAPSPTGLPEGGTSGYGTTDTTDTTVGTGVGTGVDTGVTGRTDAADYTGDLDEERRVQLSEEQLQVGKREVEAGRVRLRKVVNTEQVEQPVELRREEVDIERVPASGQAPADTAFQEETIDVPVMREEPVVAKEAQVTGEVRVGKDVQTETQTVGGEVRSEDVVVDRDDVDATSRLSRDRTTDTTDTTRGNI